MFAALRTSRGSKRDGSAMTARGTDRQKFKLTCGKHTEARNEQRFGWAVVAELVDDGISSAKGRRDRSAFDRLLQIIFAFCRACPSNTASIAN